MNLLTVKLYNLLSIPCCSGSCILIVSINCFIKSQTWCFKKESNEKYFKENGNFSLFYMYFLDTNQVFLCNYLSGIGRIPEIFLYLSTSIAIHTGCHEKVKCACNPSIAIYRQCTKKLNVHVIQAQLIEPIEPIF